MTLTQLIAQVRVYLQDPGTRWPDAEITQWLNESLVEFCIATGATQTDATLSVNAKAPANAFYTLPADLISLTSVWASGVGKLEAGTPSVFECIEDWEQGTGTPCRYLYGPYGQSILRIWPYQAGTVKAFYVRQPATLTNGSDVPEILSIYHIPLAYGAISKAYAKDFDYKDPEKVNYFRGLFEQGISQAIGNAPSQPTGVPYRHL